MNSKLKIVTFHSYKGGAGRSSATLNTLPYLVEALEADKMSPILLLDMDLDSAGMTYLLDLDEHFQKEGVSDIKDFIKDEELWSERSTENLETHNLYKKFVPVGEKLGVDNEAIVFLGVDDEKPIDNNEMTGTKQEVFGKLRKFCKNNDFKAVVIDSSAGDQFSAVLSIGASDMIVHCLRATKQFRVGTFNYLRRHKNKNTDKKIILLPTVVPNTDRVIDGVAQRQAAVDDFLKRIEELECKNVLADFIDYEHLGINEVERFKWQERVLYNIAKTQDLTSDEEEAAKQYSKLAQLISGGDWE
jgi:cellulose biosynthesis protein BcsQ